MYAGSYEWKEKGKVRADICASALPATMPYNTDDVDGIPNGYELTPYSTFYVTGNGDIYILGTQHDWVLQ